MAITASKSYYKLYNMLAFLLHYDSMLYFNGIFLHNFSWASRWRLKKSGYTTILFVTMSSETSSVLGVGSVFLL